MSFGGRAASSSGCAIRPRERETGSTATSGEPRYLANVGTKVPDKTKEATRSPTQGSIARFAAIRQSDRVYSRDGIAPN